MKKIILLLLAAVVITGCGQVAKQTDDPQDTTPPSSVTVPTDYPTISGALAAVSSGSTINVAAGTYDEGQAITINKSVSIIGAGMTATTVYGGFVIDASSVTIKGFTISKGISRSMEYKSMTVYGGAGIIVNGPNAVIMYNNVSGNPCEEQLSQYPDQEGRGIIVNANTCTIKNNLIVNNSSMGGNGIGILLQSVTGILVENNTIRGNNGYNGGNFGDGVGIKAISSTATIRNNIITEHTGVDDWHGTGDPSTITGYGIVASGSTLSIDYNDLWHNPLVPGSTGNGANDVTGGGNIPGAAYYGCSAGAHDIAVDPVYGNGTTLTLSGGSPCIGAGSAGVDMGAHGNSDSVLTPQ